MEKNQAQSSGETLQKEQDLPVDKSWLNWIVKHRFVFIVIVILVQNLIYTLFISWGFSGSDLFGSGTGTLVGIFCALAVSKDKRSFRIGLIWGILSIISVWLAILFAVWPLALIYQLFILYTTLVIIYNVTVSREININIIFGSIAGFLLIGAIGTMICMNLELISPGSFSLAEGVKSDVPTFFYFTFITMTSLGYGDITPATDIARMISVYLVIFGQLYLAIQVAILVGKFIMRSDTKQRKKEIEALKEEIRLLKNLNK